MGVLQEAGTLALVERIQRGFFVARFCMYLSLSPLFNIIIVFCLVNAKSVICLQFPTHLTPGMSTFLEALHLIQMTAKKKQTEKQKTNYKHETQRNSQLLSNSDDAKKSAMLLSSYISVGPRSAQLLLINDRQFYF